MSTRNIRISGDEVLRKTSKPVKEMTPRIQKLLRTCLKLCMKMAEWAWRLRRWEF